MKKKVYGIDLDGVCFLFSPAFCTWLEDKLRITINPKELTSYYWYECVDGLTKKDFWKEFHKFGHANGYEYLNTVDGAVEAMWTIFNNGHDIHFITNRPKYAERQSVIALKNNGFPQETHLHIAGGDKRELVRKLNVDVFIDDSPQTVIQLATGTRASVYCMDAPYNRQLDDTFITRVHNWDEFLIAEGLKDGKNV